LALLPEISEQSLLYDLEMRYRQGQIYVRITNSLSIVRSMFFIILRHTLEIYLSP